MTDATLIDDPAAATDDGRHDFDFYFGRWRVRNERLKQRLAGSDEWEVFQAVQHCEPILGGLGNVDDFISDWTVPGHDERFIGMTLRLFNPEQRQWSLYWAGNHDGVLDPPVVGAFRDGVGTFVGQDEHDGQPVQVRFVWDRISANSAHWHQAFSTDQGRTWETNWHMWMRRTDAHDRLVHDDAVIELRQYTLQPGRRDELIDLFEREFIEPQEAVGMHVIGQFRDLDDPDRYVWLRGFPGMPQRAAALDAFYGGSVWRAHREAANATMIDSDDVLLLRPARPGSGFAPGGYARAPASKDADVPAGARAQTVAGRVETNEAATIPALLSAAVCTLNAPAEEGFTDYFERRMAPLLREHGAQLLATYATEPDRNTYPRLPVREGERVFVWFVRCDDAAAERRLAQALNGDARWRAAVADALLEHLQAPPKTLRLAPTRRSELRG